MPYTELEKMNYRACCELIAKHAKNEYAKEYARLAIEQKEDYAIKNYSYYTLKCLQYERKWSESKFTPHEARQTLKRMIKRGPKP